MASVFDVPALQTPDIGGNFLSAYQTGQDRAVVNQRRLSQVAAGQAAARGDLSGAANTAYGAGDLATGQAFANMDQAQKDKINSMLAQGAELADTPEKWDQYKQIVEKQLGVPIKATFQERDAIRQLYGPKPEKMTPYQAAQIDIEQQKLKQTADGKGGEYGLAPFYIKLPSGKIVAGQMSKGGGVNIPDLPPGAEVVNPYELNALRMAGKTAGAAQVNLPSVENASNRIMATVDAALNDPSLASVTGPIEGRLPTIGRGGAARAQSRIDEIQGGAFLAAYNDLRGGGQITEVEGQKATDALNRLRTQTMNDADYRTALQEFKTEVQKLVAVAKIKAEGAGANPNGAQAPAAGAGVFDWTPDGGLSPAQ